jgi:hypothetical protein
MKIAAHSGVNIAQLDEERLTDVQAALDISEILRKFSTYSCRLVIFGDFSAYTSKALRDFMYECKHGNLIGFAPDEQAAILYIAP